MPFIEWSDKLCVGIKQVDDDHQELVRMVNDLHDAMAQGKSKVILGQLLDRLASYTVKHFNNEEVMFEQTRYPKAVEHQGAHERLTQQVLDFKGRFDRGAVMLSVELMNFLKGWLVDHIQGADAEFAPYLRKHGIQ